MPIATSMEKAIERISKLPEAEQEALADIMLEEIASEKRWMETFSKTQNELEKLGREALREFEAGKTEPLDPEKL